jgi:hypothetical protein
MDPIIEKSIAVDGHLFTERRTAVRQRVYKGASIAFNNGYSVLECVVKNRSDQGARLAFGDALGVPPRFALQVAGEEEQRQAEVRWRGEREVGVRLQRRV